MNDPRHESQEQDWNGSQDDRLVERLVDRSPDPADWDAYLSLASRSPRAWHELFGALRDDAALGAAVEQQLAVADRVQVPTVHRAASWRVLSGWAAALMVTLLWASTALLESAGGLPTGGLPTAGLPPGSQALGDGGLSALPDAGGPRPRHGSDLRPGGEESLAQPVSTDYLIGELPPQLVRTRPALDGEGYDVVYVRRLVERGRFDQLVSFGTDEHGEPRTIPMDPITLLQDESF